MTVITLPRQDGIVADPPKFADINLPRVPQSVGGSRTWLAKTLAGWDVDSDTIDDAVLVLSEIATNAIVHNAGTDDTTVTAAWWHGHLRVTVSDPDLRVPVLGLADDEHGRGLAIVGELATRWGTTKTRNGKITYFEMTSEASR
ncbi:MAG: ATP-binding protein [Streptomyces sp.]|nr:ATP-binding protein [Streptomyces sp.]